MTFAAAFCERWLKSHLRDGRHWNVAERARDFAVFVVVDGLPPVCVDDKHGRSYYMNREDHARELERKLELYLDDGASLPPDDWYALEVSRMKERAPA